MHKSAYGVPHNAAITLTCTCRIPSDLLDAARMARQRSSAHSMFDIKDRARLIA